MKINTKKLFLVSFLAGSLAFPSLSYAQETQESSPKTQQEINVNDISFSQKISQLKTNNPSFFVNQKLPEEDFEIQSFMIEKLNDSYFKKENFSDEEHKELFTMFIRNIIRGYNDVAESIWNFSENSDAFNIDLSGYGNNSVTPLMGAAISGLEGGNIEYAITLIERGANPNQKTIKNNISTLSMATIEDNYKVVLALLVAGSNPLHADSMGLKSYDYANKHDSEKSKLLLINYIKSLIE